MSCFYFRLPGSVLASHPLVLTALSSLNSELLSEAAVNGIIIETRCYVIVTFSFIGLYFLYFTDLFVLYKLMNPLAYR